MTDTNKERAEFEAWAVNEGFQIRRLQKPEAGRDYGIDSAQDAWEGWQARAAKAPAAPQGDGDMLRAHAEGRVTHINNGLCPDIIEGHDTRDPECPVCQALLENHAALPAPPQGAAKEQK